MKGVPVYGGIFRLGGESFTLSWSSLYSTSLLNFFKKAAIQVSKNLSKGYMPLLNSTNYIINSLLLICHDGKTKKKIVSSKLHTPIQVVHSDVLQAIYHHADASGLEEMEGRHCTGRSC